MAQRLSLDERARVEAMSAAGVSVAETARRLGRHRSTVHRELRHRHRCGVYDAEAAQTAADGRARRPKAPVLVADPELAASVRGLLEEGWSPHAIRAALRDEGRTVSAETIYRACYDHSGSRGLPEGSWRCLPRRRRHRKPRGRHARKPSPLGVFRPICERPASVEDRWLVCIARRWQTTESTTAVWLLAEGAGSTSRSTSVIRARRGSAPPTSRPGRHCLADRPEPLGHPRGPHRTSAADRDTRRVAADHRGLAGVAPR